MPIHAGLLAAFALLLVVSGGLKVSQPKYTVGALRAAGLPSSTSLVLLLGLGEIGVGLAVVATGSPIAVAAMSLLYLAFTGFVVLALRRNLPISSCGCFGKEETPPSVVHVALNLVAVAIGIAAIISPAAPWLGLTDEGLDVVLPFVAFTGATVYLLYAVMAVLPRRRATGPMLTLSPTRGNSS